jgi:hypothetical protein
MLWNFIADSSRCGRQCCFEDPNMDNYRLGSASRPPRDVSHSFGFSSQHCRQQQLLLSVMEFQSITQQIMLWASVSTSMSSTKTNDILSKRSLV